MLQPQGGDSASAASQGWLPFGNGGQEQEVLLSLGHSKRPPHARRAGEALMVAHDTNCGLHQLWLLRPSRLCSRFLPQRRRRR